MSYVASLLERKRSFSGITIDTNLLLLFLCGNYNRKLIGSYKRLSDYTEEDFDKISVIINAFGNHLTITTNVISEVCNLTDQINNETENDFFNFIGEILSPTSQLINLVDVYEAPKVIYLANIKAFIKLGMTDAGILSLAKRNFLVMTADLPLYSFICAQGLEAINYNHIRFN